MTISVLRNLFKPVRCGWVLHGHSFRRNWHYSTIRRASTLQRAEDAICPATESDEYLRLVFDDQNVWDQHRKLSYSTVVDKPKSVGLLGNPNFVSVEGFEYAAKQAIERAQIIVERIWKAPENGPEEMRRVVKNLDRLSDTLCSVIDMAEFIRNAHPDEKIMEAANKAYAELCYYMNTLNTDTRMHKVLAQVLDDKSIVSQFTPDEHAAAVVFLRDFEKSGIHLSSSQRSQFVELSDRIIYFGREFIQRNPRAISHVKINPNSLRGFGRSITQPYKRDDGFAYIPTDAQECQIILKYANDENLRRQLYEAMNSASPESIQVLELLMKTRAELALLVGKKSFGHLHLQDKMAKDPENVNAFLRTLLQHQAPAFSRDMMLLQQMKQKALGLKEKPTINAWDRDFYMHLYSTTERASKGAAPFVPYFSVGSVIQGLSRLFKHLYGVQFEPAVLQPGESWHDDVRKLDVVCEREGKIGTIYCDLFARPGKTTNAAHYTVRTSRRVDDDDAEHDIYYAFPNQSIPADRFFPPTFQPSEEIRHRKGRYQLPVIALTCDFSDSRGFGNSVLLSMFEVETLFHEMGHAMHSMLGRTDYHNVAGTRCATDFVELPSILMEHFVWHPKVLPLFAKDDALPPKEIDVYLEQRRRFNGIEVNSQILMALLDQQYHSEAVLDPHFSSVDVWHSLQDEVGLFPSVPGTMWPVQFGHLFGYGAGYYSYLFDRTLARRIWEKCFEKNPLDREQGLAFRDNLLKWGGARDPWKCVADVLGGEDGERIADGDENAMRTVGDWGIDV